MCCSGEISEVKAMKVNDTVLFSNALRVLNYCEDQRLVFYSMSGLEIVALEGIALHSDWRGIYKYKQNIYSDE